MNDATFYLLRNIFSLIFVFFILYRVVDKLLNRFSDSTNSLLQSALSSFLIPFKWFLVGLGLLVSIGMIEEIYGHILPIEMEKIKGLFLIGMISWFLFRWKYDIIHTFQKSEKKGDKSLIQALSFFLNLLILMFAFICTLDILEIPIAALLTFGGIGGIALSFAAKDILANLFGTMMIHFNRYISEGDFIRSTNKQFEGHVEEVGWFHTRLRSAEKTIQYVPNAVLTESIIENEGKRSHRRLVGKIPLRYLDADKVASISKKVESYLRSHSSVDGREDCSVSLTAYGSYCLEMTVYAYLKETQLVTFNQQQQNILLEIDRIIKEEGAHFGLQTHLSFYTQPTNF